MVWGTPPSTFESTLKGGLWFSSTPALGTWEMKVHQSCSPAPPPSRTHLRASEAEGGEFTAFGFLWEICDGRMTFLSILLSPAPHTALRHFVPRPGGSAAVVAGDHFFITVKILGLAAGLQTSPDFCWDCYLHIQFPF